MWGLLCHGHNKQCVTFQIAVRKAGFCALCYFIYVIISLKYFTCLTWIWFYRSYESLGIIVFLTVAWNVFCDSFAFIHVQMAEHVFASSLLNAGQNMWSYYTSYYTTAGTIESDSLVLNVKHPCLSVFCFLVTPKKFLWSDMMLVEAPSWGLVLVFKKFYYQMLDVRQDISSAARTKS